MCLLLVSLATGLRIASVSHPEILAISPILPQGEMHSIHFITGLILLFVFSFFCLINFQFKSKLRLSLYHRIIKYLGYCLFILSLVTGILKFYDLFFHSVINSVHLYSAYGFLLYLFLHALIFIIQLGIKSLTYIFKVEPGSGKTVAVSIVTFSFIAITGFTISQKQSHSLVISKQTIDTIVQIDGKAEENIWQELAPLKLKGIGGANFDNGITDMSVRAFNNGIEVYFLIEWTDPTQSLKHLPLLKTQTGWKVMQNGFDRFDEQSFYEDKLAVLLSDSCAYGASGTSHLGPKPLKDKPASWHGKGYHYAHSKQLHDLWHWKAVRTNGMYLADDNYIGKPDWVRPGSRRYTAGYMQDGKESGAYVMNWKWYKSERVEPKRIPIGSAQLDLLNQIKLPEFNWTLPWFGVTKYNPPDDQLPVGTELPSVLYRSNQMEGDRADVRAFGTWSDGQWTLELVRKMQTNSQLDLVLKDGVCMWFAAFDSSQIAHTRHALPIKVSLE